MDTNDDFFSTEIEVTEADIDPIFNHVHHAAVIEFLEIGRLRLLEAKEIPQSSWIEEGLLIVVTKLSVQYRGELRPGKYQVLCFNPEIHSRRIIIGQGISSNDGQILVEAQIELMFMDSSKRRVVSPPNRFIEAFLQIQ